MAEQPMETSWSTALWRQFGAAIDTLENALVACPDTLWQGRLWIDSEGPQYGTFWTITYHVLFWLDLYLTGSHEGFAPPAPFTTDEPEQPYTKEELHGYLVHLRKKCQATISELSDEQAYHQITFPWWRNRKSLSFAELQLYSMRHVQEHAAHLSLFLGQHGIPGEALDWVPWMKEEPGS